MRKTDIINREGIPYWVIFREIIFFIRIVTMQEGITRFGTDYDQNIHPMRNKICMVWTKTTIIDTIECDTVYIRLQYSQPKL